MLGTCPVALASGDCPKKPAKTSLSLASFRVSSTGTHLRMEQSGFRPDQPQYYQGAKGGWPGFFAALEQVLARID